MIIWQYLKNHCRYAKSDWIFGFPDPIYPYTPIFWIFIAGSGRVFCIFLLSHSCCPKMDCRSEISQKMRTWQYPILLSYLYLINYYLMPFWTFVNVCFWPFKMGCRTCRECKSLCQFIKFMPLMLLAFVSGRSGRKAHKWSDPHNCKCRLDILPGTFTNELRYQLAAKMELSKVRVRFGLVECRMFLTLAYSWCNLG